MSRYNSAVKLCNHTASIQRYSTKRHVFFQSLTFAGSGGIINRARIAGNPAQQEAHMKRNFLVFVVAGIFNYICIAAPKGYITYNVLKVPFETLEIQAESGWHKSAAGKSWRRQCTDAGFFA